MSGDFWVMSNRYGGGHWAHGHTATAARRAVRARIAETYAGEGLSCSSCRRAASSYCVETVGGPVPQEVAERAAAALTNDDHVLALSLVVTAGGRLAPAWTRQLRLLTDPMTQP